MLNVPGSSTLMHTSRVFCRVGQLEALHDVKGRGVGRAVIVDQGVVGKRAIVSTTSVSPPW
jgi:hypothetical protein